MIISQICEVVKGNRIGELFFLMLLRPAQIRAARALLGWRQEDLSEASGVGTATLYRIENSDALITGHAATLVRIQAALEKAGIEFIDEDEIGGFGLRFSKKRKRKTQRGLQ